MWQRTSRRVQLEWLLPHLERPWILHGVGYFRHFVPSRSFHSTRRLLGTLINEIAGKDLYKDTAADNWKDAEPLIERIRNWLDNLND